MQRCQNYGNSVLRLFIHFCDTLDISLCAVQRFSRPQSFTTSHLSHSHTRGNRLMIIFFHIFIFLRIFYIFYIFSYFLYFSYFLCFFIFFHIFYIFHIFLVFCHIFCILAYFSYFFIFFPNLFKFCMLDQFDILRCHFLKSHLANQDWLFWTQMRFWHIRLAILNTYERQRRMLNGL